MICCNQLHTFNTKNKANYSQSTRPRLPFECHPLRSPPRPPHNNDGPNDTKKADPTHSLLLRPPPTLPPSRRIHDSASTLYLSQLPHLTAETSTMASRPADHKRQRALGRCAPDTLPLRLHRPRRLSPTLPHACRASRLNHPESEHRRGLDARFPEQRVLRPVLEWTGPLHGGDMRCPWPSTHVPGAQQGPERRDQC